MAIKAPEFSNATFCSASHRTSAHQYDQFSFGTTARGMNRLWLPVRRLREGQKTTPFLQRMNTGFSILNTATTFPTKQDRIYNSNFQNAEPDIDLSVGARCLSDLGWISGACVNSRYTGADCNISSLPGRLASINRPIHQAAVLPLTHVSEASEGNKWWREGINQTEGGQTPGPWLVQSSPEMEHDGGAGLRCTMETALLFLETLGLVWAKAVCRSVQVPSRVGRKRGQQCLSAEKEDGLLHLCLFVRNEQLEQRH